jgi:Beta/Gamma crystallin
MTRMRQQLLIGMFMITAGSAAADSITLYQGDNYRGRQLTVDRALASFPGTGFNDRAKSAVVHEGRWEICYDANFRGSCGVLEPGAYPELGEYAGRISSLRPVNSRQSEHRPDYRGRNPEARATLFEGANLSGRSFPLNDVMRNLERTGFNDRASSLRIESGYWIFCSDSEFRGECRTFGPGEYADLPGMNNSISSGRQIANAYPYGSRPNWQSESPQWRGDQQR